MITFVMLVEDGNLDNAVGTLENNLPGLRIGWNVLVLTKDKNFPHIRNKIYDTLDAMPNQDYRKECLVLYDEKTSFRRARSFLEDHDAQDYLFLWDNGKLPIGVVGKLMDVHLAHSLQTGLVGYGDVYYSIDFYKLYDEHTRMKKCSPERQVTNITAVPINNVLLRVRAFMQCELKNDKIGLELRRKGYQNYLLKGGK